MRLGVVEKLGMRERFYLILARITTPISSQAVKYKENSQADGGKVEGVDSSS